MPSNKTYAFADTVATISGAGGSFSLIGNNAEEGITITPKDAKVETVYGADGNWVHNLRSANGADITVRFLVNSPINKKLSLMMNLQNTSSSLTGQNIINVAHKGMGDEVLCVGVAFTKRPELVYSVAGQMREWTFTAGKYTQIIGSLT
jgi:hypothetical protein